MKLGRDGFYRLNWNSNSRKLLVQYILTTTFSLIYWISIVTFLLYSFWAYFLEKLTSFWRTFSSRKSWQCPFFRLIFIHWVKTEALLSFATFWIAQELHPADKLVQQSTATDDALFFILSVFCCSTSSGDRRATTSWRMNKKTGLR